MGVEQWPPSPRTPPACPSSGLSPTRCGSRSCDELTREDACACELRKRLDLSAPLLSHHLKVLREAGLVSCAKVGRRVEVTLDREALAAARRIAGGDVSALVVRTRIARGAASALAARRRRGRLARALRGARPVLGPAALRPLRASRTGRAGRTRSTSSCYDTTKILLLLVGIIFVARLLRSFLSIERTRALLGGKREGLGNVAAAGLGVATPFCSCSAVPAFIGFVAAGVPLGITLTFLIASPMVNEVAVVLLYGMFGFEIAALYVASGLADRDRRRRHPRPSASWSATSSRSCSKPPRRQAPPGWSRRSRPGRSGSSSAGTR